jgi:WhiB family redox-sensing transcriptional regulator
MDPGPVGLDLPNATEEWMERGTCRGHEKPDLWFPVQDRSIHDSRAAEKLCRACPVRLPCLFQAVDDEEKWGVWGGYNMQPVKSRKAATAEAARIRAEREPDGGAA